MITMVDVDHRDQADPTGQMLETATRMIAATQFELEAKGYPPSLASMAVERARGIAQYKSEPISPEIRGRAFLDLLGHELRKTEDWTLRQQRFLDSEGPEPEEEASPSQGT